jgi:hypothetical protein
MVREGRGWTKGAAVVDVVAVWAETVSSELEESWSWLLVSGSVSSLREVLRRLLVMVAVAFVGVAEKKQEGRNRRRASVLVIVDDHQQVGVQSIFCIKKTQEEESGSIESINKSE